MQICDIWIELKDGRKALLRSPKEDDVDGILEFLRIAARETEFLMCYPEECSKYTSEKAKEIISQINASKYESMLICLVEGEVAGNCQISFKTSMKTKHRSSVAIVLLSKFWNQGIGTQMFQEMIRLAESREDVVQIELDCVEENTRARHLYEKMGFRIIGIRPNAVRLKNGTFLNEYMMIREIRH